MLVYNSNKTLACHPDLVEDPFTVYGRLLKLRVRIEPRERANINAVVL